VADAPVEVLAEVAALVEATLDGQSVVPFSRGAEAVRIAQTSPEEITS
jgi:hypothetical protein